jgi:hypothetical protein
VHVPVPTRSGSRAHGSFVVSRLIIVIRDIIGLETNFSHGQAGTWFWKRLTWPSRDQILDGPLNDDRLAGVAGRRARMLRVTGSSWVASSSSLSSVCLDAAVSITACYSLQESGHGPEKRYVPRYGRGWPGRTEAEARGSRFPGER